MQKGDLGVHVHEHMTSPRPKAKEVITASYKLALSRNAPLAKQCRVMFPPQIQCTAPCEILDIRSKQIEDVVGSAVTFQVSEPVGIKLEARLSYCEISFVDPTKGYIVRSTGNTHFPLPSRTHSWHIITVDWPVDLVMKLDFKMKTSGASARPAYARSVIQEEDLSSKSSLLRDVDTTGDLQLVCEVRNVACAVFVATSRLNSFSRFQARNDDDSDTHGCDCLQNGLLVCRVRS
jgi:hypothetical protein